MAKKNLSSPRISPVEAVWGWGWWAFQLFLLPVILPAVNSLLAKPLSQAELNFTFFLLNFLAVLLIFHSFLARSFRAAVAHPAYFCQAVILGLAAYFAMSKCIGWCVHQLDPGFQNANDALISGLHKNSRYLTILGTAVLVPLAEECFYRGLIFGTFARKALWVGYTVSTVVFALIHIMGFFGTVSPLTLVLSFLQYLPAGLCLAWSYVKADTIFAPILIHSLVNIWGIYAMR